MTNAASEIKSETLKSALVQLKAGAVDENQIDQNVNLIETILDILSMDIQSRARRHLLEMVKTTLGFEHMVTMLNRRLVLLDKLINLFLALPESEGYKLMKSFNNMIFQNQNSFSEVLKRLMLESYYKRVGFLIDDLARELASPNNRFSYKRDPAENPIEFKNSLLVHEEMFSHLKLTSEKTLATSPEARELIYKYFNFITNLRLDEQSKPTHMFEGYFVNLVQLVSRLVSFFSYIISLRKEGAGPENELGKSVHAFFENNMENVRALFNVNLNFLSYVPVGLTKYKVEAMGNLKHFFDRYPELAVANLKRLLQDEFFVNKSKAKFSETEVNKVYFYWISAIKYIIRNHRALLADIDLETTFLMIENYMNIFFEDNIYTNYLLNIMHNVGSLCDLLREKILREAQTMDRSNDRLAKIAKYIFLLLKKLVRFQKQSCRAIEDLVTYLKKSPKPSESKRFDDVFSLPKEGLMAYIEKHGSELLEDELMFKNTFSGRFANDVLLQHSINLKTEKNQKFEFFIEESVVKKMLLLNEIIYKYLIEYLRVTFLREGDERVTRETATDKPSVYTLKQLRFQERDILQRIFSQNLKIFSLLICNASYFDYPKVYEHIRFAILDFFYFKNCFPGSDPSTNGGPLNPVNGQSSGASGRHVLVKFRDIYSVFQNIGQQIMLTFIDIYQSSPENYTNNYTLFIDTFSGSAVVDSVGRDDPEMVLTARRTICAFNEVVILKMIEVMQRKKVEYFDAIATRIQPEEVRTYALRVLKGIYRKIKYREPAPVDQNNSDLMDIKEATVKLILVIMEKTYTEANVMNYLQLLRNIFSIVYRIPEFLNYFTDEVTKSGIKILGYLFSIFSTGYYELKIMAVELLIYCPVEMRKIIKSEAKRAMETRKLFDMLEMALDLNDSSLASGALKQLDMLTSQLDSSELKPIFNERITSLYTRFSNGLSSRENQFSILRKSVNADSGKMRQVARLVGKLGDYLQDARELGVFDVKKSIHSLDEFELEMFNEATCATAGRIDLKEYVETLYQELARLKERPWFNNFYSISLNYIFFCTVKHKRGLEKLFDFLLKTLTQLETAEPLPESQDGMRIESESPESSRLWEKTFECLYNVVFLMHPFKIADAAGENSELRNFKAYIETSVAASPSRALKFMELILKNVMLNLELASEEIDTTIFNFVREFVGKILFEQWYVEGAYHRFLDHLVNLLTNRCVYGVNAAVHLFKELVLEKGKENEAFAAAVEERRMSLIKALSLAYSKVDKRLKIRLNSMVLQCYRDFLVRCVRQTNSKGELEVANDLEEYFSNLRNFEDGDIFQVVVELSRGEAKHYEKFFKEFKNTLTRQMNTYLKALKYVVEDKVSLWTFEFLQVIKSLLAKLIYGFEKDKYRKVINLMSDKAVTIIHFVKQIRDEIGNYDKRERESKSSTILLMGDGSNNWINHDAVYYTDFDLRIHVDRYDYIIKEFCVIFELCTEVIYQFFTKNRFEQPEKNENQENPDYIKIKEDYIKQKEQIITHMIDLGLRVEKSITRSVLKIVPLTLMNVPRESGRDKDPLQQFKILLRMFQKNEVREHNLYIISKLVKYYPKLINNEK